MKLLGKALLGLCGLCICISCVKTTEKYASKEHGMKFGSWTLNYNSGDYDVYWPSLSLPEPVTGNLTEIVAKTSFYGWMLTAVVDTTYKDAQLTAAIRSVKSSHDAQYFNSIRFRVTDKNMFFRDRFPHHFIFNEGGDDSVSFSAMANNNNYFIPDRETSDMIIKLLSGHDSVSLKVIYQDSEIDGQYSFMIEGEPQLKKALTINQERKILADKEFKKADAKFEQEIKKFFD